MYAIRSYYVVDEIDRVGRQPLRKLGADDRLIKPLRGTLEYGLPNGALLEGIAAALYYQNADDPQAVQLQTWLAEEGPRAALVKATGLSADLPCMNEIVQLYEKMK